MKIYSDEYCQALAQLLNTPKYSEELVQHILSIVQSIPSPEISILDILDQLNWHPNSDYTTTCVILKEVLLQNPVFDEYDIVDCRPSKSTTLTTTLFPGQLTEDQLVTLVTATHIDPEL